MEQLTQKQLNRNVKTVPMSPLTKEELVREISNRTYYLASDINSSHSSVLGNPVYQEFCVLLNQLATGKYQKDKTEC